MGGKIIFIKTLFLAFVSQAVQYSVIEPNKLIRPKIDKDDGKSSLVFVFDTTGSMYNDLRQLREGAEMILQTALEESNVIADFVFVPFHDPAVGPATVTNDKKVFKSVLNLVRVNGGGDCPEKSLGGIELALKISRPRSFIYVFTDATASDHSLVGNVLENVQRKQSQVVFILTGHCNDLHKPHYKVYHQIATASSGQVFNLNKTSVYKVLDFVRSSIKGRTVNLASAINPPGYNYTKEIPVDESVSEVTVSVSGLKPQIHVVNPSGDELTGPPQLVTTLDLSEIMIVKVLNPEPGNWSVTVGSEKEHSVKVVGLSNLTFEHGFSVSPPASMDETSYRPLQGAYNHLLISVAGTDRPLRVQNADILTLNGDTKFEVALKEVGKGIYRADAFIPPEEFFYIAVRGRDEHDQEFRRVGSTAIQAKSPDVPYLVAPKKVQSRPHERAVVSCHAESLVPLTVSWARRDSRPQVAVDSLQSTSLDLVIENMSEADEDTYDCVAKNAAGVSRVTTVLELIVDQPQVTISATNTTLTEHEDLKISCSVISEALLLNAHLEFHGKNKKFVTKFLIEPSVHGIHTFHKSISDVSSLDAGMYTCVAANRGGQAKQSIEIKVQNKPTAQILGPHKLAKSEHTDIQVVCQVENALEVHWLDPNQVIRRTEPVNGSFISTLNIRNVTEDGTWTCVALRDKYRASDAVEVVVLMKPHVRIDGPKDITILNGTIEEVACTIVSNPAPRILWHMETEKFLDNTVTQVQPNVYKSVLTLNSSKENVQATFFCVGENSEGIHQDYVNVNVRRKMMLVEGFSDLTLELYSKGRLPCVIDSHPPPNITWYHNDTVLHFEDNVNIAEDDSSVIIQKVDFVNLGSYRCVADNGYENITVTGNLDVRGLEAPILEKGDTSYVARKGEAFSFTCRVLHGKPEPSITWEYKNSTKFTTLPRGVKRNRYGIDIQSVDVEHAGLYRCVAQNIIGADMHDVQLVVQYPPQENNSYHSSLQVPLLVAAGGERLLSCSFHAIPSPVVIWTKDSKPIAYSNHLSLTDNGDLLLANASGDESGVYTCNTTNSIGSLHKNFTVHVFMSPVITIKGTESEIEVQEGQLVELPCSATAVPKPHITWLHNGQKIVKPRKRIDETGLRFVANVTDFGDYSCVATNEHGTAKLNYTVLVWVPPYIKGISKELLDVHVGSNVSLKCDAVGFPVPDVLWEFQDNILIENSTDLIFNYIGDLFIRNASFKQEGVYACIAHNNVGAAMKIFHVTINEGPKFVADDYAGPYIASTADSALTVTCRAAGRPAPYVYWIKDGYYLDKDARYETDFYGTLTIKNPTEDLSGTYTCLAKNAAGNITKDIPVEIYPLHAQMSSDSQPTTVNVLEGSDVNVKCPFGRDADSVKWYKDAILISNETLKILNVSRTNASIYACVVNNLISSAHAEILLDVEWPPKFLAEEELEVDVISGDDWYFDCNTDAKPPVKTKWLFNSKPLLGEDRAKIKLLNVQLAHMGLYRCVARNEHGTIYRQYTLNVLQPPHISRVDELDVLLKAGVNATLECDAKGSPEPTITWKFNNTQWKVEESKLLATNISSQAEGWFRCEATNRAGTTHVAYRVSVVSAPTVTDLLLFVDGQPSTVNTTIDIVIGSNVRIACKAIGNPSPVIQWIRYGNTVGQNSGEIGYADLMLTNVSASQSGDYQCFASNDVGFDQETIKVKVLEPPRIFQTLFENTNSSKNKINLEILSGQAFFLQCHPYGNPPPEVYWFKDGFPLHLYDATMTSTDFGEVILTNSVKIQHSGNYTCVARNKVGESSAVYLVDVLSAPPKQKEEKILITQSFGKQLNLTCPAEGTPQPYVSWMKLPYTEITDSKRVHLVNDNSSLIIIKTQVSDSGKYSCIATNKVGTTEVVFEVTIERAPSIAGNTPNNITESHEVALGRSIVLKCDVNGNPTPKISWLKDIQPLGSQVGSVEQVLNGSILTVWTVRARHAGTFACVAQNSAGLTQRRYDVIVKVPGKWSAWSRWSYCNVTCGLGYQVRSRLCQYIDEDNDIFDTTTHPEKVILDESACKGSKNDSRKCHMPACETTAVANDGWSRWSAWTSCSATCGAGSQTRARRCRRPPCAPADNLQIRKCPKLPKCEDSIRTNNVYGSSEDVINSSEYMPEATFEMQPQNVDSYESEDEINYYENPTTGVTGSIQTVYHDVNVTENLDGSDRGPCKIGYRHNTNNNTCDDIDECSVDTNQCHATQLCANTAGAYRCGCAPGFRALGAGQRCLDINECQQGIDGCEWACVNVAGGFVCACPPHLRLQSDRRTCRTPSSNRKNLFVGAEIEDGEYLSTSIVGPTRYYRTRH